MEKAYKIAVHKLIDSDPEIWPWMRRRASKHYELMNDGRELEGSSDVSCYIYDLWKRWKAGGGGKHDTWAISIGFGYWINGEILDMMGIPRTIGAESYHDWENS